MWQYKLLLLLLLLISYAFFSASEISLFSIDKRMLKKDAGKNSILDRYMHALLDSPKRLLATILIAGTIVNISCSILAVNITIDVARDLNLSISLLLTIEITVLTVVILLFGEIIPKLWAAKHPLKIARIAIFPIYWINVILYPAAETLTEFIRLTTSKIKIDKSKSAIKHDEISELAGLGHERGTIEDEEHGIISGIIGFRSVAVYEVMTPRTDMISIPKEAGFAEIVETINKTGHSRIPLYDEDPDTIIGIVYAKDLLPYFKNKELQNEFELVKIARKPMFIPPTKKINDLMHEFQEKKMHLAIVVDEYGGTSGVITLEDILEEIIGEIQDEYDKEENTVTKLDENSYIVLGKLSIDELKELLGIDINTGDDDFETVGGLVLSIAGNIPREGFSFNIENYKFTVKEIIKKRIKKVLIVKMSEGLNE